LGVGILYDAVLDIVHCLSNIRYTWHCKSWLYSGFQVIYQHHTGRFFIHLKPKRTKIIKKPAQWQPIIWRQQYSQLSSWNVC
jgi:hypothetical protein